MPDIGRGDGDDVDRGVGDQRLPVAGRAGEAEAGRGPRGKLGVGLGQHFQPRPPRQVENPADGTEGMGVAAADEARADQADADGVAGHGVVSGRVAHRAVRLGGGMKISTQ